MRDLKILYYSNAFIASHGGRLHSEAFLKEADKNVKVKLIEPFPVPKKSLNNNISKEGNFKRKLKKIGLLQILFFYRRNENSFREIVKVLNSSKSKFNVLHIRVDSNFLIIPRLKKRYPNLIISTEVNASPFDENFKNIAFLEYFKKIENKALEKADANFFVSEFLARRIMGSLKLRRDFVVHNGVDLSLFTDKKDTENRGELVFGYVGTIDYHKDLPNLIDAFYKVLAIGNPKIRLIIVGDGPMMQDLKKYIISKGIGDQIELIGWMAHNEVPNYLNKMDIAIHHSANPYMSPLKIFEYMAVGLPVIAPDIPAVREVFKENEEIVLTNNDSETIASKMLYLLENEFERKKIAHNGKLKIREYYGWDSNADKILNVLQEKNYENN